MSICGSQRITSSVIPQGRPPWFLTQGLTLAWSLPNIGQGWLAKEPWRPSCICLPSVGSPSLCHHIRLFDVDSGDGTQTPMFMWQLLYQLSHLPSTPCCITCAEDLELHPFVWLSLPFVPTFPKSGSDLDLTRHSVKGQAGPICSVAEALPPTPEGCSNFGKGRRGELGWGNPNPVGQLGPNPRVALHPPRAGLLPLPCLLREASASDLASPLPTPQLRGAETAQAFLLLPVQHRQGSMSCRRPWCCPTWRGPRYPRSLAQPLPPATVQRPLGR